MSANAKKMAKSTKKKNIQAVVRVRPLSGTELMEKSRSIVFVDNVQKVVNLREKTSMRTFGPFDKIYDADATQEQIYKEVVAPLIFQVLDGYNCTIFAYGQTGSGKTYTMEGNYDKSDCYETDPTAGIIPRALHHIFTTLEREKPEDYSVRASYVELYNENVFDLLGAGAENSLRVYDNKDKGGVLISGMEDVPVRSYKEVHGLLRKGAERRKTASTLMNIHSSRSHSVFTLTVTTRQTIDNEELLRIGKVHLVDLAGSENVGKSGAIDMRAREAGNINTSLLALGRVIHALTSNAAHVPYRESKLTRILQDSLGGKTITTIIANLSPASSNFEETVNTLEYVQRAKNIKNNPEANQCISRKQILLAYDEEIARLKRDLLAARTGGGFYVDKENYDAIQAENAENRARIEELEVDLANKLSELTNLMNDLTYMDEQYKLAYERLRTQAARYERGIREQEALKKELSDTQDHYQSALDALDIYQNVAVRLRAKEEKHKQNAVVLFEELSSAHDKIDHFRQTMSENDRLLGNFSAQRIAAIADAKNATTNFLNESEANTTRMVEQNSVLKGSVSDDLQSIKEAGEKAATMLRSALELVNLINTNAARSAGLVTDASTNIGESIENEQRAVRGLSSTLDVHFTENQRAIEHFAHQEIKREAHTGATPQRRAINESSLETLSPIPTKAELLKNTSRTPQRLSVFRIRDSILEKELPDSPNTLKSKLPSVVLTAAKPSDTE